MVDGTYVQLTKEQEALEDITPGELNQPIDVVQITAARCPQCGQALPESYHPPANEDWSTGIFGCADDPDSCWTGLFCPCVLFGRNVESLSDEVSYSCACMGHVICIEGGITLAALMAAFNGAIDPQTVGLITEGLLCTWWICGVYTGMARQALQRKYHLKDSPCEPSLVHLCLHWCAICQEHREMKCRLSNYHATETTIVNPPPVQEMIVGNKQEMRIGHKPETSSSNDENTGRTNLELQPI
ncbi:cell number regulator 6-like [Coffea arabica]|uniref:Cell number regulator 6-like n=1 Tax=Coffea arabica TaxID=13443 RepID=A0ABM4X0G5_COFAR|nr:cell number regulator 6-like [Coffea arabica]